MSNKTIFHNYLPVAHFCFMAWRLPGIMEKMN